MRLLDAVCGMPWLIQEPWLRTIIEIVSRENESVEAVEARLGRKLDNTRNVTMRDGVAVIPVTGPIFRYANLFTEVSGATSTQALATDIQTAIDNGNVRSIVLAIDSPGGEANGIHELSELIYAARAKKPVVAYVGGMAASAGYWIASAADEIVIDATAMLGSIGVVYAFRDPGGKGAKDIEIVSTQSPKKRLDVDTEAGRSQYQKYADELASIFVSRVARNRQVSEEAVINNFGEGALRTGSDAVSAGMADRIGSFESLISEMKTRATNPQRAAMASMEVSMNEQTLLQKIKALVMGEPAATAAVPTPEAVDAAALAEENEKLKAALAEREAADAVARAEERTRRIAAEVVAFEQSLPAMGLEAREKFVAKFRAALDRGDDAAAADVKDLSLSYPPVGVDARVNAGGAEAEAAIAAAAGDDESSDQRPGAALDRKVIAALSARGISAKSANYHAEYAKEALALIKQSN